MGRFFAISALPRVAPLLIYSYVNSAARNGGALISQKTAAIRAISNQFDVTWVTT